MRAEILIAPPLSHRGEKMLRALARVAPPGSVVTSRYSGQCKVLVIYGPGAPVRLQQAAQHRAGGGRVVMWDLGYWDREATMRLSVDTLHPTAAQLELAPDTARGAFFLRQDADPAGPIMLVGLGPKSCVAYGYAPMQWEHRQLDALRARFPGREILWRPKGDKPTLIRGTTLRHGMPIHEALSGCSLVVCRHSNVAVDACIAGVPVECEDGAALALYHGNPEPTIEQRARFLQRLSWFNWGFNEAQACWNWIAQLTR